MEARCGVLRAHALLDHPPTGAAPLGRGRAVHRDRHARVLRAALHADADRVVTTSARTVRPAAGPPWDLPVAEAPLAFVDLEMTGLDAANDRVVEVCIDRVVGGRRVELRSLARPPGRARRRRVARPRARRGGARRGPAVRRDRRRRPSRARRRHPRRARGRVGRALPPGAEMKRAGRELTLTHWLDTLVLARRAFAFPSYSLDALCRSLEIDRGRAHRADSDVAAMRVLFDRCVADPGPEERPRPLGGAGRPAARSGGHRRRLRGRGGARSSGPGRLPARPEARQKRC